MKVSRNALERYIDLRNISDEEIAIDLHLLGLKPKTITNSRVGQI